MAGSVDERDGAHGFGFSATTADFLDRERAALVALSHQCVSVTELDGDSALDFLAVRVRLFAGQCVYQGRFPVVDVSDGSDVDFRLHEKFLDKTIDPF